MLAYLKSKDLGLALSAYAEHELWGLSYFTVEVTLTENGLKNYEAVVEATF